ncbi:2-dehydro-3-deoxygalactonokinase [Piscinibacter defluvii]|uniref:2-dehydro-3-deoxygalactonokinase n=1 Tax=Piscinibacter defluvii TaxID=1796922 RepID=UPI000FDE58F3|nr:2-dehydro-3-deoxygalactonokinase [Piscinibacter defluvii]
MIAVDWGTSSFRAYRLADDGSVRAQRSAAAGLLACGGRFEAVLAQQLEGWDDELVAMAGMIGSRSGWHEVPYVAAPAGAAEIAAGMHAFEAASLPGRRLLIAPGLSHQPAAGAPEVMRGEETQIVALLDRLPGAGPHVVCLPGTHSKWVRVEAGRITGWQTAMTGELYALLRQHSLLAALMPAPAETDGDDPEAFARGLAASADDGGLTHHLFGVRTRGLSGALQPGQAPSFLSGLLIGHELKGLVPAGATRVHLVGSAALLPRYERALAARGLATQRHDEALSARGLHALVRARRP